MTRVKKYGVFELRLAAHSDTPFDISLKAVFITPNGARATVFGFYDGEDCFVIRFMPEQEGVYRYETISNLSILHGAQGQFLCEGIAGPGKVMPDGLYLKHADGTRHHSVGTTCYAWIYQPEDVREQTMAELEKGWFNKIRMCVFPKWYLYNEEQPDLYPFEGSLGNFDYERPNVKLFQRLEHYIMRLGELGIQADIILFHPYDADNWGFSNMTRKQDEKYIRYVTARLGAYANVWWSAANEYDLFRRGYKAKQSGWKSIIHEIAEKDPFGHMLGIHQCFHMYNHRDRHITHCSVQRTSMYVSTETSGYLQKKYRKPIVWDEINYEGDIKPTFGNCTPQELLRHFWEATVRGAYAGHGETYADPQNVLWWSKGGVLHGESHYRIKFLREVMADYGWPRFDCCQNGEQLPLGIEDDRVFAWYYGCTQSTTQDIVLPACGKYQIEVIDTWNMERRVLDGLHNGVTEVFLGQQSYMAVFAKRVDVTPPPARFDGDCLLRDLRHYKGGKKLYWILKKTPILNGNTFVFYDSLNHLKLLAGDALTDDLIRELCEFANDGKLLRHLRGILRKR